MAEFQWDIVVSFILPSEIYIQYTSEILQVCLYFKERYQVLNLLVIHKLFNVPVDLNLSFLILFYENWMHMLLYSNKLESPSPKDAQDF